jgi:hypothetical protein
MLTRASSFFVIGSFLASIATFALLGRLTASIVITDPDCHFQTTLACLILIPAIAGSLLGGILVKDFGQCRTISGSLLSCFGIVLCFWLSADIFIFSRWHALLLVSLLSTLIACAFVPIFSWLSDSRKHSSVPFYAPCLFVVGSSSGIWLSSQPVASSTLCQVALLLFALAFFCFKVLQHLESQRESSVETGANHLRLILPVILVNLAGSIFLVSLSLAIYENYQNESISFQNLAFPFSAGTICGALFGALFRLIGTQRRKIINDRRMLQICSGLLLFGYALLGQIAYLSQFLFVYTTIWSISLGSSPLKSFSRSDSRRRNSPVLSLSTAVGLSQSLFLLLVMLLCFSGQLTAGTSISLESRCLALGSSVVLLLAIVFGKPRAFCQRRLTNTIRQLK